MHVAGHGELVHIRAIIVNNYVYHCRWNIID